MHFHRVFAVAALALSIGSAAAQWDIQDAHTTASLRGIHYVGNGVAWASGTDGTVLRTEDMGFVWQLCTIPSGAEKLDFRGIQAFDNNTAIVMSSGKGDLSRLYKTTDGCQTWKLVFTNPDKDGFWDAMGLRNPQSVESVSTQPQREAWVLGDPVGGQFALFRTQDAGQTWKRWRIRESPPWSALVIVGEGAFAASNSSLVCPAYPSDFAFVTGGELGSRVVFSPDESSMQNGTDAPSGVSGATSSNFFTSQMLPIAKGKAAGAFSVAARYSGGSSSRVDLMIVGGNYEKPNIRDGTAVHVFRDGASFHALQKPLVPPNGYRSAVAWYGARHIWITVGPNGTDVSTDDGRNWRPLKPGPSDAPDADQHWNALSLPFVVGPKGRIGLLREDRLKAK